jgi:hypothetical protein
MKKLLTIGIILLMAAVGQAATLKVVDPFGSGNVSGGGDIIGTQTKYDIQDATMTVSATSVNFVVDTNYGGTISYGSGYAIDATHPINSFSDSGYTLYIGDLILYISGVATYGVALTSHPQISGDTGSVTVDHVYKITNQTAVATANQVTGCSGSSCFPTQPVWIHQKGGLLDTGILASITATPLDGGVVSPEWTIGVTFSTNNSAFNYTNPFNTGASFGFSFASASCANDYITGQTPEPATMAMVGGALTLLSLLMRKRRAS